MYMTYDIQRSIIRCDIQNNLTRIEYKERKTMKHLNIQSPYYIDATVIPNRFLDEYMPRANGEFVKVFLMLMRALSPSNGIKSVSAMADSLNCTEADVLRALKFWENEGLLELSYEEGALCGISFTDFGHGPGAFETENPGTFAGYHKVENNSKENINPLKEADECLREDTSSKEAYADSYSSPERDISPGRMKELKENEEIKELIYMVERCFKKTLSASAITSLAYYYDKLNFSSELIEYLIEYCVSGGHKSFKYIDSVALSWYNENIRTVNEAKRQTNSFNAYYKILKALGISGRDPIDNEIRIMKKWTNEYCFPLEIITEACTRTVMNTKSPSLKYTDSILTNWKEKGVETLDDIKELDKAHRNSSKKSDTGQAEKASGKQFAPAFNKFDQRKYDYDSLESRLLKGKKEG